MLGFSILGPLSASRFLPTPATSWLAAVLAAATLLWMGGCPDTPSAPSAASGASPDLRPYPNVSRGGGRLFTFFNNRAEMQTVDDPAEVPPGARLAVKVIDPHAPLPGDLVMVADLTSPSPAGGYPVTIRSNGQWLDEMMPRLSQLKSKGMGGPAGAARASGPTVNKKAAPAVAAAQPDRTRDPSSRRQKRRPPSSSGTASNPAASAVTQKRTLRLSTPKMDQVPDIKELSKIGQRTPVLLFSTSWCPSCRTARQFFVQRGVAFEELDVEKDPQAMQQYMAIQRKYRLREGVVPLILVGGRAFQGFSKPQIEAALSSR